MNKQHLLNSYCRPRITNSFHPLLLIFYDPMKQVLLLYIQVRKLKISQKLVQVHAIDQNSYPNRLTPKSILLTITLQVFVSQAAFCTKERERVIMADSQLKGPFGLKTLLAFCFLKGEGETCSQYSKLDRRVVIGWPHATQGTLSFAVCLRSLRKPCWAIGGMKNPAFRQRAGSHVTNCWRWTWCYV